MEVSDSDNKLKQKCFNYLSKVRSSGFISDDTWKQILTKISKLKSIYELEDLTRNISKQLLMSNGCIPMSQFR